jgi:hypothetical protein
VFDKNPIPAGSGQTGHIVLESPSYTDNTPVIIRCSDPSYKSDVTVNVAKDQSVVPFSFTMPALDTTTTYQFKAVRPCGETDWVPVTVQHQESVNPRIKGVVVTSPQATAYSYPFTQPTVRPEVNLARFAIAAGSAYTVQVTVTFCDPMPDTATINADTFKVYRLGETLSGSGVALPADIQILAGSKQIVFNIPSTAMFQDNYYRIVLKGAAPGPVMAASGAALAGSFDREFNGTFCSGGESPSDFRAEFYTVWKPNQMT